MLIKTSAKFESNYNLLAVYCYLDKFVPACFKMQVLVFEAASWTSSLFIFTLLQTVQRHKVDLSAYDMTLLTLLGLLLLLLS